MDPNTPVSTTTSPAHSQGPVVGIIIVLVVLAIGAFFFFTSFGMMQNPEPLPDATTSDATMSTSDDPNAIASELETENFNEIDAELDALDAELNQ